MPGVTPIGELRQSMPEQGRIRIGKKGTKGQPQKIHTFRFTSHDEEAIRQIAERYGGSPRPWSDGPRAGEWEVESTVSRIPILLPPNPLGEGTPLETPIYEDWSRGGLQRRCDGELCLVSNGEDLVEMPCICDTTQQMQCKPKTRLIVILREIQFGGGWRIETGGYTAARELPGMVKMLLSLQGRGISAGFLTLREEKAMKAGKTLKFMVPMLSTDSSADELVAGQGMVASLGSAPQPPALTPGHVEVHDEIDVPAIDVDDEVHDAEIVEEVEPDQSAQTRGSTSSTLHAYQVEFYKACGDFWKLPELSHFSEEDTRHAVAFIVSKGRTASSKALDETEMKAGTILMLEVLASERRLIVDPQYGTFKFSARKTDA